MAPKIINVLVTSFSGLNLPATLSLPLSASISISDFSYILESRLPQLKSRTILTTTSNKQILATSTKPISSLLSSTNDDFLPLRLSIPLCGGKGGFGSQLRAAGGRMSSRRKKNQGENNGSNRNLDGRRLRTVTEAKALAEYLALKPDMDKKEKEQRRKRWEQVVEAAERREDEIKTGSKGRVDGKWVEDKEEAEERTRDAVTAAMKSGNYKDNLRLPLNGSSSKESDPSSDENGIGNAIKMQQNPKKATMAQNSNFFTFGEDDEFLSDDTNEDDERMSDDTSKDDSKFAANNTEELRSN
ncbi:MAG: hypothetical protein M1829_002476 [Trizodia sp. TS-e1964]|nr:MAG: hypothetical protein M1829_002476 [Trizodia sp. TS-e1964]